MALGGSVTYGQQSSHGNGYRESLYKMLMSDGYSIEMVGSRKSGSMKNSDHEGWRGFRIEQIIKKAKQSVSIYKPNVFTLNAGANDCLQDFEMDCIGKRMASMLDYLWTTSPGSTIILSTLLVNADKRTESRVLRVNQEFREIAEQKLSEHRNIVLVDMHGGDGPQIDELTDGTHPNDAGYDKMANIWHRGFQEAVSKRMLPPPRVNSQTGRSCGISVTE